MVVALFVVFIINQQWVMAAAEAVAVDSFVVSLYLY